MSDHDRLFLLTGRSASRHQAVYSGISLTDENNNLRDDEIWKAWIISNPAQAVSFVRHEVTMSHLSTSQGSRWEHDGIISKASDVHSDPARPRQNEVRLLKCLPPVDLSLPVFAAGNRALKPSKDTVVITLNIRRLIEFPDIKVHLDWRISHFGMKNTAVANDFRQLESTSPEPGTVLPVEIGERGCAEKTRRCVLLLEKRIDRARFLCKLYRSDSSSSLHPGNVLRRRACLPLTHQTFISESDIGTIERVIESNAVCAEEPNQGIVNQPPDGVVFPIECATCKQSFVAADFTPQQLQVIDQWSWYYPIAEERSLLERAVVLFRQHPGLQGEFDARIKLLLPGSNRTLGQIPDPRSESSKKRFLDATAGDPPLREFLSSTSCNYDRRYQMICESAKKYEQQLNGQIVICLKCGDGPVIIRHRT